MADTYRQMLDAGLIEPDNDECRHGWPNGEKCPYCEIDNLKCDLWTSELDVIQLMEAVRPFVESFERVREINTPREGHDRPEKMQDFLDRNLVVPSGTSIGDWRRLADAFKDISGD